MRRRAAWALAVLLALFPVSGFMEEMEARRQEADAYYARVFDRAGAVGGAVIVNKDGERAYAFFYGAGDKRGTRPVDENTVYKVASVSKLVSAVGVMTLKDAGLIDLDAPLTYGENQLIRNPFYPDATVTLRQVMSHTSSLLGQAPYASAPQWARINENDGKYFAHRAPGSRYEYANLNGGFLCSAVERASGLSFNTYMRENVFSPLGINAAYAAHLLPDPAPLSHTYTMNGEVYMKAEHYLENDRNGYDDTCDPDAHYHASAGSLYISLSGLEKIGAMLACGGKTGGVRVLSPTAAAEMRADQARVPGSSVTGDSPYGLNMYRYTAEDGLCWYGHQGRWQGLLVDLFVEPGSGTAVVFVMNGVGRSGAGEMDAKAARALARVGQWLREQADTEGSFVVEDDEEF